MIDAAAQDRHITHRRLDGYGQDRRVNESQVLSCHLDGVFMGGRRSDFLKGVCTQLTFQGTQVGKIAINPRGLAFYFRNFG
ncbi:hypothetical protein D3C87_1879720 [compost metagenome]